MFRFAIGLLCGALLCAGSPPARIVSTSPSITEILFALGLGDRVVGVTRYCRFPAEALNKPKIGDYTNPNIEAIAAQRPDLVILQNNPIRLSERLHALRLQTLEVHQETLRAVYESIIAIGRVAGAEQKAVQLNAHLQTAIRHVNDAAAHHVRPRVMFVAGRAPGKIEEVIVAGRQSYVGELLELAGGENIFADAKGAYPQVSLESILARNPEVVIDFGDMADPSLVTDAHKKQIAALWRERAGTIKAVKEKRVYAVAADIFVVPGPRAADAVRALSAILYPEPNK
jgi:iron complex transport system substrate-binding protein